MSRYFPTLASLNQIFWSTSTIVSISFDKSLANCKDLFSSFWSNKFLYPATRPDIKLGVNRLPCLYFAQNHPTSVLKTLQSWSRALKVFHQTSLPPLCSVFCHAYEKSLKRLEIGNILSVSNMSKNQATNSSISIFKWIYIDVSKQICSSHN